MADQNNVHKSYLEDLDATTKAHHDRSFDYEKLAVEYTANAFRTLTYLNGGALVALPAAVALFQIPIITMKAPLILSAGSFIGGILAVCFAQAFAFFTMARRSEAETCRAYEQKILVGLLHYPQQFDQQTAKTDAKKYRTTADNKIVRSNRWRFAGILATWASAGLFLVGCYFGAKAIL